MLSHQEALIQGQSKEEEQGKVLQLTLSHQEAEIFQKVYNTGT